MTDYGYGDAQPDYGYGEDMGYGDGAPDSTDYGYGNSAPDNTDYGYGDSAPATDYGYGDAAPEQDYGYGDSSPTPAPPAPTKRRPRRRCSVTKYSLEEASKNGGAAETEMVQELNAAQMIQNFRSVGRGPPNHTNSEYSTDSQSSTA